LAAHAVALSLLLVALLPVIGTTSQFSADEGAAIAQAVRLERGDGWTMTHPFPAADPEGAAFPFELSVRAGDRYATFAKHPVYPVVLAAVYRVAGRTGMVLLSVAGTIAAALLTALLARRLASELAVPALWMTGLASPLFFDGYVVIAHTIGAACAAAAALCVIRALDGANATGWLAGAAAAVVAGTLMRTEMQLFAIALSVAVVVATFRRGRVRWLVAAVPTAAALFGWWLDRRLLATVVSGPSATTASVTAQSGVVAEKVFAFVVTWLLPSYSLGPGDALLVVAVVFGAVASRIARTRPTEHDGVRLFAVVAAAAGVARLFFGPEVVPGLLIAFPFLLIGVAAARRSTVSEPTARLMGTGFALFSIAVLATQYGSGGGGEWGGRYFAIGLPLIVPLGLAALAATGRNLDRTTAKIAAGSLVVLSLALSVLAVVALRQAHRDVDAMVAAVDATSSLHPALDGGAPVVLSSSGAPARLAFPVVERTRWLTVPAERLGEYARRLRDLDVGPVTFVTREKDDLRHLETVYRFDEETHPSDDWIVVVLRPR